MAHSYLAVIAAAALAAGSTAPEPPPGFARTGAFQNCIKISTLRDVQILNRKQILFTQRSGETFLNEPESCAPLRRSSTLVYDATLDQLCTSTIITLLEPQGGGMARGQCGLAKFEKLTRKPGG